MPAAKQQFSTRSGFTKALLSPRTLNEANHVLFALGAGSPHLPQQIILDALAYDATQPIQIKTRYELTEAELTQISSNVAEIAADLVLAQTGQAFPNPNARISYLSSPSGGAASQQTRAAVERAITEAKTSRSCVLALRIDPKSGGMISEDPIGPVLFSYIERQRSTLNPRSGS